MAQGEFTKVEAAMTIKSVNELFDALPKSKRGMFVGHLNDIILFIGAALRVAPTNVERAAANPTPPADCARVTRNL